MGIFFSFGISQKKGKKAANFFGIVLNNSELFKPNFFL